MVSVVDSSHGTDGPRPGPVVTGRFGRRVFIAGAAGALAGATALSGAAQAAEPGASSYQVVDQRRLCDSRARPGAPSGFGYQRIGANWIRVGVTNQPGVPANAVAAVLTVTVVSKGGGANYVTVFPAGESVPDTSSVNAGPSDSAVANLVTIKLGGGAVDLTSFVDCDLIVDLVGIYLPATGPVGPGRLVAFPSAVRALDTRSGGGQPALGSTSRVNLNGLVPGDAIAVVATLTAVGASTAGYVTASPRGTVLPDTSNLNLGSGETRAVAVITRLGTADGVIGVDLFNFAGAHLLFDVVGYMTGAGSELSTVGLFVPISPTRVFDTRREKMRVWNGGTRQFGLPAPINARAQAVAMNLTVTATVGAGYYTLYAAQTARREVSNLNVTGTGQTIANHAICRISTSGVAVYGYAAGHVICDITGWFTGVPERATNGIVASPPPPGGPIPWIVQIPRLGINRWVLDGDATRVVDAGNTWHWSGTGLVGEGSDAVLFGHRTEHGGPYRYQHTLQPGDTLSILTADARRYDYVMWNDVVTSRDPTDILNSARRLAGETISIVACSKPDRQPTSLQYRLISTFVLVGWEDLG